MSKALVIQHSPPYHYQ